MFKMTDPSQYTGSATDDLHGAGTPSRDNMYLGKEKRPKGCERESQLGGANVSRNVRDAVRRKATDTGGAEAVTRSEKGWLQPSGLPRSMLFQFTCPLQVGRMSFPPTVSASGLIVH